MFGIQWRIAKISNRNQQTVKIRGAAPGRGKYLVQQKIAYAHQFAAETVISQEDLVYTTETDLLEQEAQTDEIDAEWQRRLRQSGS
jgi:hypothetical protein